MQQSSKNKAVGKQMVTFHRRNGSRKAVYNNYARDPIQHIWRLNFRSLFYLSILAMRPLQISQK